MDDTNILLIDYTFDYVEKIDEDICCVCYSSDKTLVRLKCSKYHYLCDDCYIEPSILKCPLCRTLIESSLKRPFDKVHYVLNSNNALGTSNIPLGSYNGQLLNLFPNRSY